MAAIEAMVVRETGEGMMFPDEAQDQSPLTQRLQDEIRAVTDEDHELQSDDDGPDEPPRPPRGKPNLKLVK